MQFYSIFVLSLASLAFATSDFSQADNTDCLNICKDSASDYSCPPGTSKTQISSVCVAPCSPPLSLEKIGINTLI